MVEVRLGFHAAWYPVSNRLSETIEYPKLLSDLNCRVSTFPMTTFVFASQDDLSARSLRMLEDEHPDTVEDGGIQNPSIRMDDGWHESHPKKFYEGALRGDFRASVMLDVLFLLRFQSILLCIQ